MEEQKSSVKCDMSQIYFEKKYFEPPYSRMKEGDGTTLEGGGQGFSPSSYRGRFLHAILGRLVMYCTWRGISLWTCRLQGWGGEEGGGGGLRGSWQTCACTRLKLNRMSWYYSSQSALHNTVCTFLYCMCISS